MEANIKKLEETWTADGKKLGLTQSLFHREKDIKPDLQLYATYLEIEDYEFGEVFFVPTDYIAPREADDDGGLRLIVKYDEVMKRTWFRMPDFIAFGQSRKEELVS
jgi:hypothetical protein